MTPTQGMSLGVTTAINDLLDHVAELKPGHEVLILAHLDGLYGGDNLVDETAISWIQSAIHQRDANASVLWIDEPHKPHAWRFPPVLKEAMRGCDTLISHSFNITIEDTIAFTEHFLDLGIRYIRNFATTSALLNTAWAQTPSELVAEIRYQAATAFERDLSWELTADNGTHLEGKIAPPKATFYTHYASRRGEAGKFLYFPWPEWCFPPIYLKETNGVFVFDRTQSWWSRYVSISPFFNEPITLSIENGHIVQIKGGTEARALKKFLESMKEIIGDGVYDFICMHSGVHPHARVSPHQCPNVNYRRLIESAHACNISAHIGPRREKYKKNKTDYPYWMHLTADIMQATWRVGDRFVHKNGHLVALDHPNVQRIAKKYPDRPGIRPQPFIGQL